MEPCQLIKKPNHYTHQSINKNLIQILLTSYFYHQNAQLMTQNQAQKSQANPKTDLSQ